LSQSTCSVHVSARWLPALLWLMLGLATGSAAVAHTPLLQTSPQGVVTQAANPLTAELVFKQPTRLIKLTRTDGQSQTIELKGGTLMSVAKRHRVPLGQPGAGRHTVHWRALSADGHVIKGQWHFEIATP